MSSRCYRAPRGCREYLYSRRFTLFGFVARLQRRSHWDQVRLCNNHSGLGRQCENHGCEALIVFKEFFPLSRNLTCHINRERNSCDCFMHLIYFRLRISISFCKKSGNHRCFPEVVLNALHTLPKQPVERNALIHPCVQRFINSPCPKQ